MLEVAESFAGTTHEKTLVFVSSDGASIGALGAKRFMTDYTEAGLLDAAVVLSQPAASTPEPPLVVPWSNGAQSTASRLTLTASETLISEEVSRPAGGQGPLADLFRLALPASFGEQGPLVEGGIDSVRLSSAGELPLEPSEEEQDYVNGQTLDRYGRASLALLLALDRVPGAGEHGPDAYIGLAGNLLPGPDPRAPRPGAAAAGDRGRRRRPRPGREQPRRGRPRDGWAALRAVPFLLPLALVLAFGAVGVIPSPDFPYDPATESLGRGGTIGSCSRRWLPGLRRSCCGRCCPRRSERRRAPRRLRSPWPPSPGSSSGS